MEEKISVLTPLLSTTVKSFNISINLEKVFISSANKINTIFSAPRELNADYSIFIDLYVSSEDKTLSIVLYIVFLKSKPSLIPFEYLVVTIQLRP